MAQSDRNLVFHSGAKAHPPRQRRASQTQSIDAQDAFQVGEQHFNLFSNTASRRAPGTTLDPGYRPVPKIRIINANSGKIRWE
jgi:hypothetical protein